MKTTVTTLQNMKAENKKIAMLTCYDYSTAKLMDEAGVDRILVGDALGNTMLGYNQRNSGRYDSSLRSCCKRGKEPVNRLRYAIYVISVISI